MSVDTWLNINAPGYHDLSKDERSAIRDFALLWSLFESSALNKTANANRIIAAIKTLSDQGRLDLKPFTEQITYFFNRYHNGTDFTPYFAGLRLRNNDHPELVRQVLCKQISDPVNILAVLFIIIYRLRNNLLHGHKWSYEIKGQLENFHNANKALMTYIGLYC